MTTPLKKAVRRRTEAPHRGRRLVVSLLPGDVIGLRPERTRREEFVSLAAIYDFAVKARVLSERAAKMAARKGRRK